MGIKMWSKINLKESEKKRTIIKSVVEKKTLFDIICITSSDALGLRFLSIWIIKY